MEFQVLGTVVARHNGVEVGLGRRHERLLLGVLLMEPGLVFTVDRLLELLWPEEQPASARATLQTYVARLRARLAPYDVRITRRGAGYAIDVDPQWIDLHRFTRCLETASAAAAPVDRIAAIDVALALWLGRCSPGWPTPRCRPGSALGSTNYG